jgi:hypothetical protein
MGLLNTGVVFEKQVFFNFFFFFFFFFSKCHHTTLITFNLEDDAGISIETCNGLNKLTVCTLS